MITSLPSWKKLEELSIEKKSDSILSYFEKDSLRMRKFTFRAFDYYFDFTKNHIDDEIFSSLLQFANDRNLKNAIERMFNGEKINITEKRAVLHTALRSQKESILVDGENIIPLIQNELEKVRLISESIRSGTWKGYTGKEITDVVNLGIGGSDLGPAMVTQALASYSKKGLKLHFVSNVDGTHLWETLKVCNPETTVFIVASKTFTTQETIVNANAAKDWLLQNTSNESIQFHFIAVSTNLNKAIGFGINKENIVGFWDWVGGRYSIWSSIGISVAIAIGFDQFKEFLAGANEVDTHFENTPLYENIPVIMALLGIWYTNFLSAESYAVLPYEQYLCRFPAYLQQLDMESNGKQTTLSGEKISYKTGPLVWGEPGTNGQHAFYQLLHQGTRYIPVDFLIAKEGISPYSNQHTLLIANCIAQAEALLVGKNETQVREELQNNPDLDALTPHKIFDGNRPSTIMVYPKLTPKTVGSLLAFYEHKVFVQGILWDINSFDQWGVELGKQLATAIIPELQNTVQLENLHDPSTKTLIELLKK